MGMVICEYAHLASSDKRILHNQRSRNYADDVQDAVNVGIYATRCHSLPQCVLTVDHPDEKGLPRGRATV